MSLVGRVRGVVGPGSPRPRWWPHFSSTLRSTALTARLGRALGIAFLTCLLTGLLSHYQYGPWRWLPEPASPVWFYRVTQGLHVITGIASIPLLLIKLWSVFPNLWRWPSIRSVRNALERLSVAVLVSSALVQVATGLMNVLGWYAFNWFFPPVHRFLAYVLFGSVLLHIGVKLPDIKYGLQAKLVEADVLTEIPWSENPHAYSNAGIQPAPPTPGIDRRGVLAATGVGIGVVVATTLGQTVTPLEPIGLLATRARTLGPQGLPVNRTAAEAQVMTTATAEDWRLQVQGPNPFSLSLAEVEALATAEARLPIACVEGWSSGASWRGVRLLDLVLRCGGTADSTVVFQSLEQEGGYRTSSMFGPRVSVALLATHLNGQRLDLDHGYPLRLISPNRPGVFNTKWLSSIEIS